MYVENGKLKKSELFDTYPDALFHMGELLTIYPRLDCSICSECLKEN